MIRHPHLFAPSRRLLLGGAAASLGALALPGCSPAAEAPAPVASVHKSGIQLYTVRQNMEADLPGTLRAIRAIGYEEVEFAGYFTTAPAEVKRLLDEIGLTAPSAHVPLAAARENPQGLIDAAKTVGHEYLVIPYLGEEERRTLDQYRAVADALNAFAAQCRDAGVKLAYHNHDFEFQPIDGAVPYSVLLERCDADLVKFELDIFWATKAAQDVPALLAANSARMPLCHVKDMDAAGNMVDVGAGQIDFKAIFAGHPFDHYYVEHDEPTDPMATATASYAALHAVLASEA